MSSSVFQTVVILLEWLGKSIQRAYEDVSEEELCLVMVQAHEVHNVAIRAFFKKIKSLPAVLKAGTWRCPSTFVCFYLWDVTGKYLDTFSMGSIVLALNVVY